MTTRSQPIISIVMPARNAEKTIRQAVQSVLDQTYTRWELIVIDGGSEDSTVKIVQEMKDAGASDPERKSRIRILKSDGKGVAAARNCGIRAAQGKWIAFLDSDDLWHPDKLRRQMRLAARKKDAAILYTGSAFILEDGRRLSWQMRVPPSVTFRQLLKQNVISCSSVMIRRELALRYPMVQDSAYGDMHEDYLTWLRVLRAGGRAYGLKEPLLIYRLSKSSRSGNKLRAAAMTYRVYRSVGLGWVSALYNFFWYAMKNIKKYRRIYKA